MSTERRGQFQALGVGGGGLVLQQKVGQRGGFRTLQHVTADDPKLTEMLRGDLERAIEVKVGVVLVEHCQGRLRCHGDDPLALGSRRVLQEM